MEMSRSTEADSSRKMSLDEPVREGESVVVAQKESTSTASDVTPTGAVAGPSTPSVEPVVIPAQIVTITSTSPSGLKTRNFPAKYFKPVSSTSSGSGRGFLDLPESYFAPTPSELQTAFAGQVRKREMLVDAPLLTRALREKEALEKKGVKANRWPQTRIRIRFTDRSQLESVFPSTDTLTAIYEFVKCSIEEKHRQKPFVLYQTPPRQEYLRTDPKMKGKSLIDLQLTPSSVFYIKFEDEGLNESTTPPLIPALLSAAADLPLPPPFDPAAAMVPAAPVVDSKSKSQKLGFGGSSGKVVPAWMRGGKSGK